MTSRPPGLSIQGQTRDTMVGTEGSENARWSKAQEAGLRADWSLQIGSMKVESLLIADQHAAVNAFPGLGHAARQTVGAESTSSR